MNRSLGRVISRALVDWVPLAEIRPDSDGADYAAPEEVDCVEASRMPLAPQARHLGDAVYRSPPGTAMTLRNVDYYAYLNALVTRGLRRRVLQEANNVHLEHPEVTPGQLYYWRGLYVRRPVAIDGLAMPLRSTANNYYHTLVDNLPRLWALHQPRFRGVPIKLLVPGPLQASEAYFLPRLLPENVAVTTVEPRTLYRPEAVLFSRFLSRQMCGYLPKGYLEFFRQRVLPTRRGKRSHRIYITRRNSGVGRRIANEPELVRVLERYGFVPQALEALSLEQQIGLFFDAQSVVAPHGAGLTNLLWGESLEVIELHPTREMFPHYYFLCLALGHRYRYLCGSAATRNSDFSVDLERLEPLLEQTCRAPANSP